MDFGIASNNQLQAALNVAQAVSSNRCFMRRTPAMKRDDLGNLGVTLTNIQPPELHNFIHHM